MQNECEGNFTIDVTGIKATDLTNAVEEAVKQIVTEHQMSCVEARDAHYLLSAALCRAGIAYHKVHYRELELHIDNLCPRCRELRAL